MQVRKEYRILSLPDGRDIVVPGWVYSNPKGDSFHFSYAHSTAQNAIVFLENHTSSGLKGEDWVPISSTIPAMVIPRPGFEDGMLNTMEDYVAVYWKHSYIMGSIVDKKQLDESLLMMYEKSNASLKWQEVRQ